MTTTEKQKAKRGFAAMSLEKRTEIARRGGAAVKPENRSFSQNNDLAKSAGTRGGEVSREMSRRAHTNWAAAWPDAQAH